MAGLLPLKTLYLIGIFGLAALMAACGGGSPTSNTSSAIQVSDVRAFPNLSTAKAALGTQNAVIAVTVPQAVNNLTIPANIRLRFADEGKVDIGTGKTMRIDGPLEAPLSRVFAGGGNVVFGYDSVHEVYPEWWGGADGVESATAIQSAIDSIPQGTVVLSAKTYLLDRRVRMQLVGSGDAVDAILIPKSGVGITGKGNDSVLKVVDDFTSKGDYVVFGPRRAEETSDISFGNFRMDGNGARNLVNGVTPGQVRRAMAIWLFRGRNVLINAVRFENQPGTNVVKLGSDNLSYLVAESVISNCTFANVGGAIQGNRRQTDHCSIYVSGRDVSVKANRLYNQAPCDENGPPVTVVAGIEMHGDDMVVSDNVVENLGTGGYIVGDGTVTSRNQRWTNNRFINMTKLGISIWSVGEVGNILVDGNTISLNGDLDQGVAGIFQPPNAPDTTVGISGITVTDNRIFGANVKAGSTVWNGIQLSAVTNAVIKNNIIKRISGAGIILYGTIGSSLSCRSVLIKDNTISDVGFNRYGACPYAIAIINDGLGGYSAVTVSGNEIRRSLPIADNMHGIEVQGSGPLTDSVIDSTNRFYNLKQKT